MKIKNILVSFLVLLLLVLMIACTQENKDTTPVITNKNVNDANAVSDSKEVQTNDNSAQNAESQNTDSDSSVSNPPTNNAVNVDTEEKTEQTQTSETTASEENNAHLILQSTPVGAEVYANGVLIGKTPIDTNLLAVYTKVEVKQYGYVDYVLPIAFNPGDSKSISAKLILDVGIINVGSTPSRAMVYINGKYKGKTPIVTNASFGQIANVTLKLTGYQNYDEQITIDEPKKTYFVNPTLVATN